MKTDSSLCLVMVPLACCLSLAASSLATAAPSKKTPPPPAGEVMGPPPPKSGFIKKLNPFRKKDPPPAPAPPPALAKNSKKTAAPPASPQPAAATRPPSKTLANAKTARPTPVAPPTLTETKKPGFLARVKSSIGLGPDQATESTPGRAAPVPNTASDTSGEPKKFLTRIKDTLDRDRDAITETEKPDRPPDWKERWVINEDSAAFFEFGPSQATGPDRRLNRGNVVKLAGRSSRGWAKVELEDGQQGYIGTDQMRQALENDFAGPSAHSSAAVSARLASVGVRPAVDGWSPMAPIPDLPALPSQGGPDSMLLLPPLEFEGTELKKSSLRLPTSDSPTLQPGDAAPTLSLDPGSTPVLEEKLEMPDLEAIKTDLEPAPVLDTSPDPAPDSTAPPESPDEAAPASPPPDLEDPVPVLPPPSEPDSPA